jgi:hypothetical protein
MTSPENFISRWARLKRSSDIRHATEPAGDMPGASAGETPAAGDEAAITQPEIAAAIDEPFDPASLPPVETITVNTDIRGFLQSRVPAALTRAALRQAWTSDPSIRDFIGIAENQWDFNDPNAMPGFGPLPESDDAPARLAQALGRHEKSAAMIPEMPVSVEPSRPAVADHEPADPADPDQGAQQSLDGSASTNNLRSLADESCGEGEASSNDGVAAADDSPRNHRSHGSALPR